MKTAKLGAIFLVAIMSLTALGAAYAHWEETLTISGTMTTDDIDPKFECEKTNDPSQSDADPERDRSLDPTECGYWDRDGIWQPGTRRVKDVGYTNALIPADGKSIVITVGDAYPCYYGNVYWCTKNHGSCPVLIHSLKLTEVSKRGHKFPVNVDLVAGTTYYVNFARVAGVWTAFVNQSVPDPQNYHFSITPSGESAIDTQLDPVDWSGNPSEHMTGIYNGQLDHDLCIHFENGCWESTTYDFTIELCFYNWPHYTNP